MYAWLRPLLFRLDPERAHRASLLACQLAGASSFSRAVARALLGPRVDRPVEVMGLRFANPIGLAAGYDKDGEAWRGLASLGFGHVEVGTVTPRPQPGNPKPRVFRLPIERSLINRLGFPGMGADVVATRLSAERPHGVVLGVNLGKNKDTPNERAAEDYVTLVDRFASLADYLVVNVSSPNTEGLRNLQAREQLDALLGAVRKRVQAQPRRVPLLVKLSPDLDDAQLDDALDVVLGQELDGVIATNTTIARPETLRSVARGERGGLSGAALRDRATAMIAAIAKRTGGRVPIIGVGGIATAADVRAKLDAGAALVQIYTGLIYEGPTIVRKILREL